MQSSNIGTVRRFAVIALAGLVMAVILGLVFRAPDISLACFYKVKVVAFEDLNEDGIQEPGEAGVPGTEVVLEDTIQNPHAMPYHAQSDSAGLAIINSSNLCPVDEQFTGHVTLPTGYSATTVTTFGPYKVYNDWMPANPMVSVKDPRVPVVIYVGMHKN